MNNNKGFTLIEVLMTVLVLTFGLLGLAGLQATSLKNNQGSYNRSQATLLAYDMADRMRSNVIDAAGGAASSYATIVPSNATEHTDCSTVSTSCTTADRAEDDIFHWNQTVSTILPSGAGDITFVASVYTITVNWDDNRDGLVNADDPNFQMSFQL